MRLPPRLPVLCLAFVLAHNLNGQDRCGFEVYQQLMQPKKPVRKSDQFESWMREKIRLQKLRTQSGRTSAPPYVIPVVVHVIHNGEPVGTGVNISDAQIQSQITVLNNDYKRQNPDAVNTPAEFVPVAGSLDLQFVLARQDPDGLPTNGIVRVKGAKSSWTVNDSFQFKSQSYWPAEDYLNIWVIKFGDTFLGFAQFPETSLPGTEGPYDPLTDGVVIDYTAFGTIDAGAFDLDPKYNKGRTTTHEVGHFLGLVHIFGNESGCGTTDYVDDTPVQSGRTNFCATHPTNSCGHAKMFQNYLDYTDDACMNLFTMGQVSRMVVVLENSPRRNSLLTSPGATDPVILTVDLEAKKVIAPASVTCGQAIVPRLEVRNRGTTTLTSARIAFLVNGASLETKDFSFTLQPLEVITLSFTPIDLPEPSANTVSFQVLQIDGAGDDDPANDQVASPSQVLVRLTPPLVEPFNSTPSSWRIVNPDNAISWQNAVAPKANSMNRGMRLDFYQYESETAHDQLISPFITFSGTQPILRFDRSYARFPNNNDDSLRVLVIAGCSNDLSTAVEVFNKGGVALATANDTSNPFVPTGESQWRSESISLSAFADKTFQVIFESRNGYGNNLYLDNVLIDGGEFHDVAIATVVSPGPVHCIEEPRPVIQVQNLGNVVVNRVQVITKLNGQTISTQTFAGLNMLTGSSADLTLDPLILDQGESEVTITIADPDAPSDEIPANNETILSRVLNQHVESIPVRQNFEKSMEEWSVVSQGVQERWSLVELADTRAISYGAFTNTNIGEESWLVSPVLDFTKTQASSLLFDTSYGSRSTGSERLRILASEDCGKIYDLVLFDKSGTLLANESSNSPWQPSDESDWRTEYLSLNDFSGKDNIRLAFVVSNSNGNNLYIDNIELYVGDDPNPPRTEELFSIYSSETNPYDFKITFNLPEKETARLVVYNLLGQVLLDNVLPGTLNQTYTINLFGQSSGIYIARLEAGGQFETAKLWIGR